MDYINLILAAIAAIASVWGVLYAIHSNRQNSQQMLAAKEAELESIKSMLNPINNTLGFDTRAQMELRKNALEFEIKQLKGKK